MASPTHATQAVGNDQAAEANDWQDVQSHARGMQQAIERYTVNWKIVGQDISISSDRLSKSGNAILTFANEIAETVDPLIKSLNAETSIDTVSETSKKIVAAQETAIHTLIKSLSEIGSNLADTGNDDEPPVAAVPASPLSPDVQAIKDGFDKMMDGKIDPRMGFGKIPPQFLPKSTI